VVALALEDVGIVAWRVYEEDSEMRQIIDDLFGDLNRTVEEARNELEQRVIEFQTSV
jgi:hypothetical protein